MSERNQRDVSNSVNVKGTAGVWTSFLGNIVIMLGRSKYRIVNIQLTNDTI